MTVPSVTYSRYAPEQIKVDSLSIGVSHEFNENMAFNSNQYLAVGEFRRNTGRAFNFIVDHEGVAIRTDVPKRGDQPNEYALYVDGDVFVTGKVVASNMIGGGQGSNFVVLGDGQQGNDPFWSLSTDGSDTLFYPGKVSLGNSFQAQSNEYTLHLARSADSSIEHAQIAVHNTQNSLLRLGILGTARESPAVINTPSGTGLEFHIGRDQPYFEARYTDYEYRKSYDEVTGDESNVLMPIPGGNFPHYEGLGPSGAPHMILDSTGHVGIHTSIVPPLQFEVRQRDPQKPQEVKYFPMTEPMALHVEGHMYGSNIVMWDHESGTTKHLDELYVRRKGVTIPANQIEPGPFADGFYTFQSNIAIMGPIQEDHELTIYGNAKITENLTIDGTTFTNQFISNDAILLDVASFCNDIYVNRDMIVNQAIRLRGQVYVETLSVDQTDGHSNFSWRAVDFTPSSPDYSNINQIGQGITTPGRFGAGIAPNGDEVNHQVSIIKRDPGSRLFNNMFELELQDKTSALAKRAAWIGHPEATTEMQKDGSLVIATPSATDTDYAGLFQNFPQNIYMFPGANMGPSAPLILTSTNVPTLGAFHNRRVGILTYSPRRELDVRGSISFSDSMYFYDADANQDVKLGLWKAREFTNIDPISSVSTSYRGIIYQDVEAPYVGIMAEPDPKYSLRVGGQMQSVSGYFNGDNRKLADWFDARHALTSSNHVSPIAPYSLYTWGLTGIGVKSPQTTLEIKDNFQRAEGTRLQILTGDTDVRKATSVSFKGPSGSFILQHEDAARTFEIARAEHLTSNTLPRAMIAKYNDDLMRYQVIIGCNVSVWDNNLINPSPDPNAVLTVGGNMAVLGDVNILGEFKVRTRPVAGSNDTVPYQAPVLDKDDVFLGGNHVVLQPSIGKSVVVGDPNMVGGLAQLDTNTIFRVYNPVANQPIAIFRGEGKRAVIELSANLSSSRMRFGVVDSTSTNVPYAFMGFDGQEEKPFLSFFNPPGSGNYFVGYNTTTPSALAHIVSDGYGSNMLRLTKRVIGVESTSSAAPQLELQKTFTDNTQAAPTRWVLHGPNSDYDEKLSFMYADDTAPELREVFCVTNNGCIGLNTSNPEYALDITNTGGRGSLRLLNTDTENAIPQIIFQTGSRNYGSDDSFDYRMGSSNNNFFFDMQNINSTLPIINVASNGYVGIRCTPSSNFPVEIEGTLNVRDGTILINGTSILEGTNQGGGTAFTSPNIYLLPNVAFDGGVTINKREQTGNLFHIYSGFNCNLLVLDSWHNQAQIHMRTQEDGLSGIYDMWRVAASNTHFYLSLYPNSGGDLKVEDTLDGYSNAVRLSMATSEPTRSSEFNMHLVGQAFLDSKEPKVTFGTNGHMGGLNNHLFINASSNVGIGTTMPTAVFNVYHANATNRPLARLHQNAGTADLLRIDQGNTRVITVQANSNVGIGTSIARSTLDIASGQVFVANGSATRPSYSFASNTSTGIWASGEDRLSFGTRGVARMNVLSNGSIQMGNATSMGMVTISSNTNANTPLFAVNQDGAGDIVRMTSASLGSTPLFMIQANGSVGIGTTPTTHRFTVNGNMGISGSILPTANATFDLGSPTFRWRDVYLSGTTLDIGGTKLSREASSGNIRLQDDSTNLKSVVVESLQIGDDSSPMKLIINSDPVRNITFTTVEPNGTTNTFTPIVANTQQTTVAFGQPTQNGALAVETNTTASITAEQNGTSNHMELYTNGSLVTIINNQGNLGIGTTIAPAKLVVQSDLGGDIARFTPTSPTFVQTVVDSSGNVGIHTTAPKASLHVVGSNIVDGRSHFTSNVYIAANLEVYGNTVTHGNSVTDSDMNLKKDLVRIEGALDKVSGLTGYTFTRIRDDVRSVGLIAQDVEKVLPEAVYYDGDHLGLAYGNMVGLLVEAIKELREEVKELRAKIL